MLIALIASALKSGIEGNAAECHTHTEKLLVRLKEKGLMHFAKEIEKILRKVK